MFTTQVQDIVDEISICQCLFVVTYCFCEKITKKHQKMSGKKVTEILFNGKAVNTSTFLYGMNVSKMSDVVIDNIVISDLTNHSTVSKGTTFKFSRIFIGQKVGDEVVPIMVKAPRMKSFGIQRFNADAKWKMTYINDPKNPKHVAFFDKLQKINDKIADLIGVHVGKFRQIKYFKDDPIMKITDKYQMFSTFLQQVTEGENDAFTRKIFTNFFDVKGKELPVERLKGNRLDVVPVIRLRDIFMQGDKSIYTQCETVQVIVAKIEPQQERKLAIVIDSDDDLDDADECLVESLEANEPVDW